MYALQYSSWFHPNIKTIYCDNGSLAVALKLLHPCLKTQYSIAAVNATPLNNSSNGQVDRFHSILAENSTCLKIDKQIDDTMDLILRANKEPKHAIHSANDKQKLAIRHQIEKAQQANLYRCNPTRQNRTFKVGENKRIFTQKSITV